LKGRGLTDPKLFIGDGALGLWAAIGEVYPQADWQRCWCHKMRNVISYFPKRLKSEAAFYLKEMYNATSEENAISLIEAFAERYAREYSLAVECLKKDQDVLLTFFRYPREHWASIKTTNPIESIFSSVRLRTNAARRIKSPRSALFLIFQIIIRAQKRWRSINTPEMVQRVLDWVKFKDGVEAKETKSKNNKRETVAA
jgi:putative transposase